MAKVILEWKVHLYIRLEYLQIRNILVGIFYLFLVDQPWRGSCLTFLP